MRILLICPFFPPENTIAALRIAKFAEHWAEAGHDVTVLCRTAIRGGIAEPSHPRIRLIRVDDPLMRASQAAFRASSATKSSSASASLFSRLKAIAKSMIWPDIYALWARRAYKAARNARIVCDVVVASIGPSSVLRIGAKIASKTGAPLAIDYRDLLASGPFYPHSRLRRAIDLRIEKSTARRASLVSTVSPSMVTDLRALHGKPTILVGNGFEPDDFKGLEYAPTSSALRITYCGTIYPGRFDPTPFFLSVKAVLTEDPTISIEIDFYGRNMATVLEAAERTGISDVVSYHGEVDHATSLRLQAESDLLLLILWDDPRTAGVVSGKLYEYVGANRPVVMLGYEQGAAAELIRTHKLGIVSNEPARLAAYVSQAAQAKRTLGAISAPEVSDVSSLTRRSQSAAFLHSLEELVLRSSGSATTDRERGKPGG